MVEIVLQFEGRTKLMRLNTAEESELRSEFDKLCSRDPVLLRRSLTHYPTFKVFNARLGMDIEIEPWETLADGLVVKVFFAAFDLDSSEQVVRDHTAIDSGSKQIETGLTSTSAICSNAEQEYLTAMGVHTTQRFDSFANTKKLPQGKNDRDESAPSTSRAPRPGVVSKEPQHGQSVQRTSTARPQTKSKSQRITEEVLPSSDSEEGDVYSSISIAALNSNRQRLQEILNIADPVPKLCTKKRVKRKGTADKENDRRVSLPRAVKARKATAEAPHDDLLVDSEPKSPVRDANTGDTLHAPSSSAMGQVSEKQQQDTAKVSTVKRRKPNKRRRLIGERITIYTVLPPFPELLVQSINKGLVYIKQKHTRRMNSFLQSHILSVTKGLYITKGEYRILRSQVVNRLLSINAPHIHLYKKFLIKKLSDSCRNIRNYRENKRPRLLAKRNRQAEAGETESEEEMVDNPRVLTPEEADEILRKPVMNKVTVQNAIEISPLIRAEYARCHSATEMIDTYPFLKNTEMLLLDYSTRVPLSLALIEQNFNNSILPLSIILSLEEPKDELQKIKLVMSFNEYFTDANCNDFPCVQLWDARNNSAVPLNGIPDTQAPALVVAVNDKDVVSASVVFDGSYLFSHKDPTAFQCVALLMASYLVYQVAYPEPYMKLLRTLEYLLHGEKKNIEPCVKNFFKKFFAAAKRSSRKTCK